MRPPAPPRSSGTSPTWATKPSPPDPPGLPTGTIGAAYATATTAVASAADLLERAGAPIMYGYKAAGAHPAHQMLCRDRRRTPARYRRTILKTLQRALLAPPKPPT